MRGPVAGPLAMGAVFPDGTDPALLQSVVQSISSGSWGGGGGDTPTRESLDALRGVW